MLQSGAGYAPDMVTNDSTIIGYGTIEVSSLRNDGVIIAQGGPARRACSHIRRYLRARRLHGRPRRHPRPLRHRRRQGCAVTLFNRPARRQTAAAADLAISSPDGGTMTIVGGGTITLGANDTNLTVFLASPTTLTLSQAGSLTAIGGGGADTIIAEASEPDPRRRRRRRYTDRLHRRRRHPSKAPRHN